MAPDAPTNSLAAKSISASVPRTHSSRTPLKRTDSSINRENVDAKIKAILFALSRDWSLGLDALPVTESPQKRRESIEGKCFQMIQAACWKGSIDAVYDAFQREANRLYSNWVHKPRAERGVVAKPTRHIMKPITVQERAHLLQCLLKMLSPESERIRSLYSRSPSTVTNLTRTQRSQLSRNGNSVSRSSLPLDDSPVPFALTPQTRNDTKRPPETTDLNTDIERKQSFKKPKLPQPQPHGASGTAIMAPHLSSFKLTASDQQTQGAPRNLRKSSQSTRRSTSSADTSFGKASFTAASFTSVASSVFSRNDTAASATQSTVDDGDLTDFRQHGHPVQSKHRQSTQYSSPDVADLLGLDLSSPLADQSLGAVAARHTSNLLELDMETVPRGEVGTAGSFVNEARNPAEVKLWHALEKTFPPMPSHLLDLPLCVRYEITRIFLHASVPLSDETLPTSPLVLQCQPISYEALWKHLRTLVALQDKPFPLRCSSQVWSFAIKDDRYTSKAILQSATLQYNHLSKADTLFSLKLKPLKLELTHRLDRRFGCGRFLEIDIPDLEDYRRPALLKNLQEGSALVRRWLLEGNHSFLGRIWRPFFTRPVDRKAVEKNKSKKHAEVKEQDGGVANRITLFAVGGCEFGQPDGLYDRRADLFPMSKCGIGDLIECVIPIATSVENRKQPFLKLFSRLALVLSRNSPTILLEKSQISFRDDIESEISGEKMTDGAGRISAKFAEQVALSLGLSYVPTGFQARIGCAKGFWSIDHSDRTDDVWIECFHSQCKWKMDDDDNHPSNRVFEVLQPSMPLKPASLNMQLLPLLENRARTSRESESLLRATISKRLTDSIELELQQLHDAIKDPRLLKSWIWDSKGGLARRSQSGAVQFLADLPISSEERINLLLDSGFDPLQCDFLYEEVAFLSKQRFQDLKKKLNIPISKSTNAYMVPDFSGCLEEGEISLHFSNFDEKTLGVGATMLDNTDVLVARNPAHFPSDIQRVRAVYRPPLHRHRDVIVFSTKGDVSLAAKLSGGDYDGDRAWVCWDLEIVNQFVNAEQPQCPDLVSEGFVSKNATTYEDLVYGQANSTSTFLDHSFQFNRLGKRQLGTSTKDKEKFCYHRDVSCPEAVELSTFLSLFVDAAKGGYAITEAGRQRIRSLTYGMATPAYEENREDKNSSHIIDRLRFLGKMAIDDALIQMNQKFRSQAPPHTDSDLVRFSQTVEADGVDLPECEVVLRRLKSDLRALKGEWKSFWEKANIKHPDAASQHAFTAQLFERYQNLRPSCADSAWRRSLERLEMPHSAGPSEWSLLKASVLFGMYRRKEVKRKMAWQLAGRSLCALKARWMAGAGAISVTARMYAVLKPNGAMIRILTSGGGAEGGLGLSQLNKYEADDDDDGYLDGDDEDDWDGALLAMVDE